MVCCGGHAWRRRVVRWHARRQPEKQSAVKLGMRQYMVRPSRAWPGPVQGRGRSGAHHVIVRLHDDGAGRGGHVLEDGVDVRPRDGSVVEVAREADVHDVRRAAHEAEQPAGDDDEHVGDDGGEHNSVLRSTSPPVQLCHTVLLSRDNHHVHGSLACPSTHTYTHTDGAMHAAAFVCAYR